MARMKAPSKLVTWPDVDRGILRIGELQAESDAVEAKLTAEVEQLKELAKGRMSEIAAEMKPLFKDIQMFAEAYQEALAGGRSLSLAHGVIGWRKSTALKLGLTEDVTIEALVMAGLARASGRRRSSTRTP